MTEPLTAADDELRRFHWYQLASELNQKEDFLALIAAERRDAVEEHKRSATPPMVCSNCEADEFACTACGVRVEP